MLIVIPRNPQTAIALNIPATENMMAHRDLAELATYLPARLAAQLVTHVPTWLAASRHGLLATLINTLASNGEPAAARDLARATLGITKDGSDVRAYFEPWHYARQAKVSAENLATKPAESLSWWIC